MSLVRLIHVRVRPDQMADAERIWKEDCAPLMKAAPGCTSEVLLKCHEEPGEYISWSEWESEDAIAKYRDSDAHHQIQAHARALQGARAIVKLYTPIP